mgnify:CR=1 FL=1
MNQTGFSPLLAAAPLALAGGILDNSLAHVVLSVVTLIMCVTVHEFGHAFVADRLGDPLPRQQGRVTLNPLAHIDPIGTVLFPALMALGTPIPLAWGKPVQWTGHPRYLTRRFSMRTIRFFVSAAGPAMNLLLALVLSAVFVAIVHLQPALAPQAGGLLMLLVQLNLGLMFFNLLPIPPLDGRSFLEFLPDSLGFIRDFLMNYGSLIFMALVMIGTAVQPSPLSILMYPFTLVSRWWLGVVFF